MVRASDTKKGVPSLINSMSRLCELCDNKEDDGTLCLSWSRLQAEGTAYDGFVVKRTTFATDEIDAALDALDPLYVYDVIQPMGLGTTLARTKVRRCLIGDCGSTYKYLGLRMFSYPWSYNSSTKMLYALNTKLREEALRLDAKAKADFSVTLVNCMDPSEDELKVSWHADSCLEHSSTIGVYQRIIRNEKARKEEEPWRIRLRVRIDAEGPRRGTPEKEECHIPALSVSLESTSLCYWMLNEFNHHHQHAIQAGSAGRRISSTHRVARREGHTANWILSLGRDTIVKPNWKNVARTLDIIEFEWLRQWFIQGAAHASRLASSWRSTIDELAQFWLALEKLEFSRIRALIDATTSCGDDNNQHTSRRSRKAYARVFSRGGLQAYDNAISDIKTRQTKRSLWAQRESDPNFWHAVASTTVKKKRKKTVVFSEDEKPIINDDASLSSIPGRTFLQARGGSFSDILPYNDLETTLCDLETARSIFESLPSPSPQQQQVSSCTTSSSISTTVLDVGGSTTRSMSGESRKRRRKGRKKKERV
uniref:Alpha-ketoglutarate-dependent dioxygenase FTO n=1 Tax=Aureoumbra lagunensis TaxID=44058 RepID=A0A7S3NP93_9STRA|mmetsp:Transcript_14133/g.21353  ORF Transcript_14133/g.21353 Transcript_14133/m.21353 type:complete len:537 (-) Transcript_14133:60-1670(-)|eukprot:CAMPEP_0197315226 /NCGR_PEP_ID=MMETSP0891-20130614/37239_1 /TAXON_ID=44058 ORGANISM="Aureoumbra lagunensis, Strain CCMP1510" /NCGR_SAMPLE_ID=MMETSP0891 /ASSEMBLY_ACC=CAM_ASM_000534 /LENGTH=536 /DNA_ID=CAMNT_0042804069 /DNA_START=27 /DNA_END=1637 /DNA_ORIENTATION=-